MGNGEFLKKNSLDSGNFLSYSVECAQGVNQTVVEWLGQHPDIHGKRTQIYCF
jgi:hypothetical protein